MFKKITEQDVQDAIFLLIEENGTTTALAVKKLLRKEGFWALQSDISKIIRNNYVQWGLDKEDNGTFNTYAYEGYFDVVDDTDETDTDETDIDDTIDIFGCCATTGQLNMDTDTEPEEDGDVEDVEPKKKIKYGKIIEDPKMLSDDTYELTITPLRNSKTDETIKLVISNDPSLKNKGTLVYEVRTSKDNWYLYSEDPNVITRHKAIYYVWRVVSQEYDGFLAYFDLRSTKLF